MGGALLAGESNSRSCYLEIHLTAKEQISSNSLLAKAYFYDENRKLIASMTSPSVVDIGAGLTFVLPILFPKDQDQTIFFIVPSAVLNTPAWSAVVIFGDSKGVDAQLYPSADNLRDYRYAEEKIIEDKNGPPIDRKVAADPVIEHVVQTDNPNVPQITLFMCPPLGVTDISEAKGVLCLCLLARDVEQVKNELKGYNVGQDIDGVLRFAKEHKLIVIGWGSETLWNPQKNWDDLSPDERAYSDKAFDQVSSGWEKGIQFFVSQYKIPSSGYLMAGFSGSAQYACRLALRKPDYFLAVHNWCRNLCGHSGRWIVLL